MAFIRQVEMFDELLEQALQKQEIIDNINKTKISKEIISSELKGIVREKKEEIWDLATTEIQKWENIETELLRTQKALKELSPRFKRKKDEPYLSDGDREKIDESDFLPKSIVRQSLKWFFRLCFGFLITIFGIVVFFPAKPLEPLDPSSTITWVAIIIIACSSEIIYWLRKRNHQKTAKVKYQEFKTYSENYEKEQKLLLEEEELIKKTMLDNGILPELRSVINSRLNKSYETIFPPVRSHGLSEVIGPEYEISTRSNEELQQLIESMPGGSIGVAGPRGAGKTTLLYSLIRSKKLRKRLSVSVLLSAPVEYNARDFILQIFSMVCLRVLELEGETPQEPWSGTQQSSIESNPGVHFLRFIGMRSIRIAALSFIIGGSILIGGSIALLHKSTITTYFIALGMSPSTLFPWGFFLVICGVAGFFANRHSQKDLSKAKTNEEKSVLVKQAGGLLEKIKFQQSYSTGWSGSLHLPLALAGSVTSTVSLAQNQLSLPEIIEEYHKFLNAITLTKEYIVVIAIDEMDKLESDEKAERFLNEIKALFGISDCFYLISVSESAMSSFERRGLPFRDVFDSSFDRIIFVNYLNYQSANDLLNRRVIGLPVPFVSLCYCLSGGLPRDLIRKCRDLLAQNPENKTLADLCNHLILTDIQVILRSLIIKARKDLSITERYQFLDMVDQLENELIGTSFPTKETIRLLHEMKQNIQKQEQTETPQAELLTYLYYVITLLEYFTTKTDAVIWENVKYEELDQLAKIRQYFSTNLRVVWAMISHFRIKSGMESFD
jgi:hypothetical protein